MITKQYIQYTSIKSNIYEFKQKKERDANVHKQNPYSKL